MKSNRWTDRIMEWGQSAIDDEPLLADWLGRDELFDPIYESLKAKENAQKTSWVDASELKNTRLVLIPFSGGLDSFVAYERAKDAGYDVRPYFVHLNTTYASVEREISVKLLGDEFEEIDLHTWPQRWKPYQTRWQHILPLRNLLIILSIAERVGDRPGEIWLGATEGEIPPSKGDKSLRFFNGVDNLLHTYPVRHRLEFPLRYETKSDLVKWWLEKGKDPQRLLTTITCQNPKTAWVEDEGVARVIACGECHACFNRWVALVNNGLTEPMVVHPKTVPANQDKVKAFTNALNAMDFETWSQRRILQTLNAWEKASEPFPPSVVQRLKDGGLL